MIDPLPIWPVFGMEDDPRPALRRRRSAGETAVLATIIDLDGGGPRPVGTQMVLSPSAVSGFLSGGCLEADVAVHADGVLADGVPRRLVYGAGSPWPDISLMCGARIEIVLEAITADDSAVGELLDLAEQRQPAFWRSDGFQRACRPASWSPVYRKRFDPTPRLVVFGADPTALAIASLGAQAGFETVLARPRGPAEPPPIPGVAYSRDPPKEALTAIGLDRWTAIAVATHDARVDHAALAAALPSPAFYVGALGARRRLGERIEALRRAGVAEDHLARLNAPIGIDLGGKSPWEVAVAVVAQIIGLRQRTHWPPDGET